MRIGILAPVATADIAHLLDNGGCNAPTGYPGAPFIGTLIAAYLQMGHEVVAFTSDRTLDPTGPPIVLNGPNFRLWICPARPNGTLPSIHSPIGRIWDLFRVERKHLSNAVAKEATDILHAHWTYEFAMVALDSNRPCLITIHDSPRDIVRLAPTPYTIGRYLMARLVFKRNPHLTAVSPYIALVSQRDGSKPPISVIANPLPSWLKAQKKISNTEQTGNKSTIIIMIPGYWSKVKNPMPGVRAFAQLQAKTSKRLALHLYGADFAPNGKGERKIRAAGISLENLHFCGQLKHHALLDKISISNALLHTSLTESFGMVIAETMALGVPVVAGSNSGAVPWLLQQGRAGQLVDVRIASQIEMALEMAIDNSVKIRGQIKCAVDSIWQLADAHTVASQYIDAYLKVLECHA